MPKKVVGAVVTFNDATVEKFDRVAFEDGGLVIFTGDGFFFYPWWRIREVRVEVPHRTTPG